LHRLEPRRAIMDYRINACFLPQDTSKCRDTRRTLGTEAAAITPAEHGQQEVPGLQRNLSRHVQQYLSKLSLQLVRRREALAPYQDAASRCCIKMLRIMARIMIVVLSRRLDWPSLVGGLKNTLKGGARAGGAPAAAIVWGRNGPVGPDSPLQRVAAPILVGACRQKRACRPATARLSGIDCVGSSRGLRVPSRDGTASLPPG
jgi:hypothetical protein